MPANPPQRLIAGRYRLLDALGRGGMGTVWRAQDELLGREVAVKEVLLPPGLPEDEQEIVRQRTLLEASTAARISHPNVVTIYDILSEDDRPWIVMELVPSRSLSEVVRDDGPLTPAEATQVGLQVLSALRVAHAAGVLHRDVKPSNVLLRPDGRAVLTDFGIATLEGDSSLTRSGTLVGSAAYIAPERARGARGTRASDLWSLGGTLYTAVEGRPPYDRGGPLPTLTAVVMDEPDPAIHSGPLRPVIEALLRKDPLRRPAADETDRMLRQAAVAAAATSAASPPRPAEPTTGATRALERTSILPDAVPPAAPAAVPPRSAAPRPAARRSAATPRSAAPPPAAAPLPAEPRSAEPRSGAPRSGAPWSAMAPVTPVVAPDPEPQSEPKPYRRRRPEPTSLPEPIAAPGPRSEPAKAESAAAPEQPEREAPLEPTPAGAATSRPESLRVTPTQAGALNPKPESAPPARAGSEPMPPPTSGQVTASKPAAPLQTTPEPTSRTTPEPTSPTKPEPTSRTTSEPNRPPTPAPASQTTLEPPPAEGPEPVLASGLTQERRLGQGARPVPAPEPAPTPISSPLAFLAAHPVSPLATPVAESAWHPSPLAPAPVRPARQPAGPVRRFRGQLIAVAAGVVVLLVAGLIGWAVSGGGEHHGLANAGATRSASAAATTAIRASTAPTASATAPTASSSAATTSAHPRTTAAPASASASAGGKSLPSDYRWYRHSTGFSVALPAGWTMGSCDNGRVCIRDRHADRSLLIDQTTTPKADAYPDSVNLSKAGPSLYSGYHLITIHRVTYFSNAADWEFTFVSNGVPTHEVKRNVITSPGHRAYSLVWRTPSAQWDSSKTILREIYASFEPAP